MGYRKKLKLFFFKKNKKTYIVLPKERLIEFHTCSLLAMKIICEVDIAIFPATSSNFHALSLETGREFP